MNDITHKHNTLRTATAEATVTVSKTQTIEAIRTGSVPKGNVFEMAKAAALLGIKKTSSLIPDCHPLPVEAATINSEIQGQGIKILVEVKTVYKTGVEVEAMHGASIAALTMYDMLKPIDPFVEISRIRLVSKTGGKSQHKLNVDHLAASVIVCSDSVSAGKRKDTAGESIAHHLESLGISSTLQVIPDEETSIRAAFETLVSAGTKLIIFCGGTGLSSRDITPDIISPLLDRHVEGVMEAARSYGMDRTPYAMLSRSVAGIKGDALVLCIPGSEKAAREYMAALFPAILHVYGVIGNAGHDV